MPTTTISHLLNALNTAAFEASLSGEILFMNDSMHSLFGASANHDRPRTIFGLGLFNNHAEFRGFLRGFKSVGPLQRIRLPSTRLQDPKRQITLNAVLHDNGEDHSVVGILSSSEAIHFSQAGNKDGNVPKVDDVPYFVFTTDGEGCLTYANNFTRTFLELEREDELTGFTLESIDLDFNRHSWQQSLLKTRKLGDYEFETNFRRPNGTVLPVCVQIVRVEGFPTKRVTLTAHNLSAVRRIESDLRSTMLKMEDLRRKSERDQLYRKDAHPVKFGQLIISKSPKYQPILRQISQVAPTDSSVLITGETGTGKELVAKSIHHQSKRAGEPLVTVNCGALPKDLIESELFGYTKGAFTGATRDRVGRFKLADEGTLFLDEIGEMPLDLQTRLLRFLQEGEFTPVGGTEVIYANVRIVAATNRDLPQMVREGSFRADLYFRLNVFPIHNIPLRDRRDDIPHLINHFIQKHARRLNTDITTYDPAVLPALEHYAFPGNIRELENIVERALIMSPGPLLTLDWDIAGALAQPIKHSQEVGADAGAMVLLGEPTESEVLSLDDMNRWYISRVLELTDGKVSGKGGAAKLLEVNPQTLFSRIRKLGIKR